MFTSAGNANANTHHNTQHKHNEFHRLGVELFKMNANSSNAAASDSLSLTPLMTASTIAVEKQ